MAEQVGHQEPEDVPGASIRLGPGLRALPASQPWVPPLVHLQQLRLEDEASGAERDSRSREGLEYLQGFRAALGVLGYAVVDELVDDRAGVVVVPWPSVDPAGRLRFLSGRRRTFTVGVDRLHELVTAHRRWGAQRQVAPDDDEFLERRVLIGDTFAVTTAEEEHPPGDDDVDELIVDPSSPSSLPELVVFDPEGGTDTALVVRGVPGPDGRTLAVLDITLDAREAGKVAFYAAVAQPLDENRPGDRAVVDAVLQEALAAVEHPAPRPGDR